MCGKDELTGKNFEHRREWIEEKLTVLNDVFAIDISAYAIMSNHTHLVLCIDIDTANGWSDEEVVRRWLQLFKGTLLIQQYNRGEIIPDYQQQTLEDTIDIYRQRLMDISWFMRILNEGIARQANAEEGCTGRFYSLPSMAPNLRAV